MYSYYNRPVRQTAVFIADDDDDDYSYGYMHGSDRRAPRNSSRSSRSRYSTNRSSSLSPSPHAQEYRVRNSVEQVPPRSSSTRPPPRPSSAVNNVTHAPSMFPKTQSNPLDFLSAAFAGFGGLLVNSSSPNSSQHYLFDVYLPQQRAHAFRTGSLTDLQSVLQVHRAALNQVSSDNPRRFVTVRDFAFDLSIYYGLVGRVEDLEESTRAYREALSLRPSGHPDTAEPLVGLAGNLRQLFVQVKRPEILQEAITLARDAVKVYPPHLEKQKGLRVLSEALRVASSNLGLDTIDESVETAREGLKLCPAGHEDRNLALEQLSNSLDTRWTRKNQVEDLDEAIPLVRESLSLVIATNPNRVAVMYNLLVKLFRRYERKPNANDLSELLSYKAECERTLGSYSGRPAMARYTWILGNIYTLDSRPESQDWALRLFELATQHTASPPQDRLEAALSWAAYARLIKHQSTHGAYLEALKLVNECLVVRPSVEWKREFLAQSGVYELPSSAASYLVEIGDLEKAVEVLEHGRARMWSALRGYRPPTNIAALRSADPELADRILYNMEGLSGFAFSRIQDLQGSVPTQSNSTTETGLDYALTGQRILSEDFAKDVEKVRAIKGFEDFLRPEPYSYLQQAAAKGPVIIVNVDSHRSDAIILRKGLAPASVDLSSKLQDTISKLSNRLNVLVTQNRASPAPSADRGTRVAPKVAEMLPILRILWTNICKPVVDFLRKSGVKDQSHIWWCPTGTLGLLPLHAAGPYEEGKQNLSDIYISSYASTLSTLIAARAKPKDIKSSRRSPRLLAVGQSNSLPQVKEEFREIRHVFDASPNRRVDMRDRADATPELVLRDLQDHPWVHFACHGSLCPAEPFTSAFVLHGGNLPLMSIAKAQLPNAELAFLAACHSAAGDKRGSVDEILSLAGALQFCGFKSVVGTLWEMSDSDGPELAKLFYEHMIGDNLGSEDSAVALHRAVKALQAKGVPVERWCTFVHIGA